MTAKYEFTGETMAWGGRVLRRIRAVATFANVNEGAVGGWIESERNLSHDGNAWVCGDAKVFGRAKISGDAKVFGCAQVLGYARVFGNAKISGCAQVFGDAIVFGCAQVFGDAIVFGCAQVFGCALVYGYAKVLGGAQVYDSAEVFGNARVNGSAQICGGARVSGSAQICGGARVSSSSDYAVFKNCWSSYRWFTYTRSNRMWTVGCFHGAGKELVAKAYRDSERSGKCYEAVVKAMEAIEEAMP